MFTSTALDSWQLLQRGRSAGSSLTKVTLSNKALWITSNTLVYPIADSHGNFVYANGAVDDLSANDDYGLWSVGGDS